MGNPIKIQDHSSAWILQTWLSFVLATSAMTIGIICLPVNNWTKGFMGMGLVFTVGSTLNLAKTTRDIHESKKITSRVDEAKLEKILNEHYPLS
ncbi:MAG: YiaA/YiaB family inner membrane protein [Jaaginema sp. PMC 1079.18]|nr:YiaA/YiaB family inner membrane protein [Jaaginema sp. PMC 1080.18]MEC4850967.1 YiaA/YiaB family inner membrane protein [Jaaginema sp. PMC 1079.18]MEC4866232.1 YiaA/YiaB family inner membrane protein [Jaaginema sp. PMC 1078.18]